MPDKQIIKFSDALRKISELEAKLADVQKQRNNSMKLTLKERKRVSELEAERDELRRQIDNIKKWWKDAYIDFNSKESLRKLLFESAEPTKCVVCGTPKKHGTNWCDVCKPAPPYFKKDWVDKALDRVTTPKEKAEDILIEMMNSPDFKENMEKACKAFDEQTKHLNKPLDKFHNTPSREPILLPIPPPPPPIKSRVFDGEYTKQPTSNNMIHPLKNDPVMKTTPKCEYCGGTGEVFGLLDSGASGSFDCPKCKPKCSTCGGTGKVVDMYEQDTIYNNQNNLPPSGIFIPGEKKCKDCGGAKKE